MTRTSPKDGARRAGAIALAFALAAMLAEAQVGGGQRRARPEGRAMPEREAPASRGVRIADPVFALERELPSLRADLLLDEAQVRLWAPFERSVRDAAEAARQRAKRLLEPRPADAPVPGAPAFVAALARDDRLRAEAMAQATERLRIVYESLTPAQRSLLDRRVLLSQSEPLGG